MGELPIVAVTVHRDGAIVERAGRVGITEGRIRVRRLPLLLDERSIRVRVDGADLREVRLGLDLEGVDRGEDPEADRALREAEAAVRRLEAELAAVREQRATVPRVAPGGPAGEDDPPDPARLRAWASLASPLDAWAETLDERLRGVEERLEKAREQRDLAVWRKRSASAEEWWRRWAPSRVAELAVSGQGEVHVALSYRIEGACWTPHYALHADASLRRARFTVSAVVAQATGEDWRGVRLAVSTAACQRAVDLPELPALRLGKAQRSRPSPWRELPAGLDELFPAEIPPAPAPAPVAVSGAVAASAAADAPVRAPAVPAGFAPPAPQSLAMAMPVARAKSAPGLVGRALSAVADGLESLAEGAAPGGAAAFQAPPPPAPGPLEVDADALDYPHLRLAGFEQPHGKRGRLHGVGVLDEAREAGLPPQGAAWLANELALAKHRMDAIVRGGPPSQHVLPGPIEGADFRFEAGDAVEVASDGRWHSVVLVNDALELDVRYRTVPRLDTRAFRSVRARMSRATPLLPGPVDVHVDGALVLTAPWKGSARGGDLEMGLGVEEGLRVVRNVRYREEKAGLMSTYRRVSTEVEVEIASSLSRAAEVEVLERAPVSKSPEITVEIGAGSPPAQPFTGDEGDPILEAGRRQVLQIAPGGKAVAKLDWGVTISAKQELVGGDRRG